MADNRRESPVMQRDRPDQYIPLQVPLGRPASDHKPHLLQTQDSEAHLPALTMPGSFVTAAGVDIPDANVAAHRFAWVRLSDEATAARLRLLAPWIPTAVVGQVTAFRYRVLYFYTLYIARQAGALPSPAGAEVRNP